MTKPIIGNYYNFFNTGSFLNPNKLYICRCEIILTVDESKQLLLGYMDEFLDSLFNIWDRTARSRFIDCYLGDTFSATTDGFIGISCPKFDKNILWCAETINEHWYSINIQHEWQGGILDVNNYLLGKALKRNIEFKSDYLSKTY